MAKGEFGKPKPPRGRAGEVIIAGQEVDLDAITNAYVHSIAERVDVFIPVEGHGLVKLIFNRYPRESEYNDILRHAAEFYRALPALGSPEQQAHPWAAFWPMTAQEYVRAYLVAELSHEPRIPIETTLVWLAHHGLIDNIVNQIEKASRTFEQVTLSVLVDAKKNALKQIASTDPQSESASKQPEDSPPS